jgi:RNA polymerase sigma-70 factor (ECF subfamily)
VDVTAPERSGFKMADAAEAELIRACQEGREDAFRSLVDRYQRRVYWIAHNMLGNADSAREISQEAFLRVFRNLSRFDVKKHFYTWLYQITVNLCIDRLRRKSNGRTLPLEAIGGMADPAPRDPAQAGEIRETTRRVHEALDRLPPKYKAVLTLRDLQGFSCEEIAEIAGCSNATVRWRIHRARQLFKGLWEGRPLEIPDGGDADPGGLN